MNEGQAGEENRSERIAKWASAFVFLLAALAIMRGVMLRLPGSITVSSSVNGQLLPISSVETEKKQVALTFDAVEGNGDTAQILEMSMPHFF